MGLHGRHFHSEDPLRLGRQLLDDILLQASQHERGKLVVEILDLGSLVFTSIVEVKVVGELDWDTFSKESCYSVFGKALTFLGH